MNKKISQTQVWNKNSFLNKKVAIRNFLHFGGARYNKFIIRHNWLLSNDKVNDQRDRLWATEPTTKFWRRKEQKEKAAASEKTVAVRKKFAKIKWDKAFHNETIAF